MLPYLPWYFLSFGGATRSWHPWTSDRSLHSRRRRFASNGFAWFNTCYSRTSLKNKVRKIFLITKCTSVKIFFFIDANGYMTSTFFVTFFPFCFTWTWTGISSSTWTWTGEVARNPLSTGMILLLKQKNNTYYKSPLHNTSIYLH